MPSQAPKSEWWEAFFATNWPEILPYIKPADATAEEVEFVRSVLDLPTGSRVLDVPCGNGRLGIPLALSGYEVTGIDYQGSLVEDAASLAQGKSANFTARQGDMRDLPWWDEFDGAICFWSSFGYFDGDGDREFADAVWHALKPGAPFLLETLTLETVLLPGFADKDWFSYGEWLVLEERSFDTATGRLDSVWTFIKDDVKEIKKASIRLYTHRELVELLSSCGFTDIVGLDTLTENPFSTDASRLSLVSKKQS